MLAASARGGRLLGGLVERLRLVGLGDRHRRGGVGHRARGVVVGRAGRRRRVGLGAGGQQPGDLVALEEDAGGDDRGAKEKELSGHGGDSTPPRPVGEPSRQASLRAGLGSSAGASAAAWFSSRTAFQISSR